MADLTAEEVRQAREIVLAYRKVNSELEEAQERLSALMVDIAGMHRTLDALAERESALLASVGERLGREVTAADIVGELGL